MFIETFHITIFTLMRFLFLGILSVSCSQYDQQLAARTSLTSSSVCYRCQVLCSSITLKNVAIRMKSVVENSRI
jgi:hypothetical protein